MRTTFGGAMNDIESLNGRQASAWLQAEFDKPYTLLVPDVLNREASGQSVPRRYMSTHFWNVIVQANDQLRQRMVFALSQLFAVDDDFQAERGAYFHDVLARNAFGNYRQLLEEVTYSPKMAKTLTYLRNEKGDPVTGRQPDENYAREIMQLMTIGVVELEMNGSVRTDAAGRPIETYGPADVEGLARVFTGLSHKGPGFRNGDEDSDYSPLIAFEEYHSPLEKRFLGYVIPAGTPADQSIRQALDHIFDHPNVAPFVSRQLIQRFTASSPSPDYVERVAQAFETGRFTSDDGVAFGTGERGDLQATLAAILLDPSLFTPGGLGPSEGKIREPVLKWAHWARAFQVSAVDADNEGRLKTSDDPFEGLAQQPFRSPSIFNFYRPGYVAPGTASGEAGLTTPEFQIVNENSAAGYLNFMTDYVQNATNRSGSEDTFIPDYSFEIEIAGDPSALTDHLNTLLTGGRMLEETEASIIEAVSLIEVDEATRAEDLLTRVELAILMTLNAPSYSVQ